MQKGVSHRKSEMPPFSLKPVPKGGLVEKYLAPQSCQRTLIPQTSQGVCKRFEINIESRNELVKVSARELSANKGKSEEGETPIKTPGIVEHELLEPKAEKKRSRISLIKVLSDSDK